MSTIRIQPHKILPSSVWSPGPWEIVIGDRIEPSRGFIEEFDYALQFRIGFYFKVNVSEIEKRLGIQAAQYVCAWAVADCAAAGVRLSNNIELSANGSARLEIAIPEGMVAGELELRRGLAYLPPVDKYSQSADIDLGDVNVLSHKPGSRLLEDVVDRIRLEGGWSRFPIEAGSFSQMGMEDAAWTVSITYDSPDDPFLGSVRLVINIDHPAGNAVINSSNEDDGSICLAALRSDVFRQLFQHLAGDERFKDKHHFEPESIGDVAASMAEDTLKNDLPTVLMLVRESPDVFDRIVQERTAYLVPGE